MQTGTWNILLDWRMMGKTCVPRWAHSQILARSSTGHLGPCSVAPPTCSPNWACKIQILRSLSLEEMQCIRTMEKSKQNPKLTNFQRMTSCPNVSLLYGAWVFQAMEENQLRFESNTSSFAAGCLCIRHDWLAYAGWWFTRFVNSKGLFTNHRRRQIVLCSILTARCFCRLSS